MDLAAAAASIHVTRKVSHECEAGQPEQLADVGRSDPTLRPRNHRERADASIQCTGLGATTCVSRRGTCRVLFRGYSGDTFHITPAFFRFGATCDSTSAQRQFRCWCFESCDRCNKRTERCRSRVRPLPTSWYAWCTTVCDSSSAAKTQVLDTTV